MHLKRLITAAILLPLLYLYIAKLPPVYFSALISMAGVIALWEFLGMYKLEPALKIAGTVLGALMLAAAIYRIGLIADLFALSFITIAALRLILKPPPGALKDISVFAVGFFYIPGLLVFQIMLRDLGFEWIIFLYGCVWAGDSLAFYVGSTLGRVKLYPSVSPKKTLEGAAGSVIGGVLAAIILKYIFSLPIPFFQSVFLGFLLGSTAIIGDLVESMFKRDAGVKDSSNLIPGHGGILDKMDGSLFSAPILYWSIQYLLS